MIVADANVLVYHLTGDPSRKEVIDALYAADPDWAAPPLALSEIRNALTGLYRSEDLGLSAANDLALEAEELLADRLFEVEAAEVLELVGQSGRSAYDCEYVALARRLEVPLLTYDESVQTDFPEIATTPTEFLNR